MYVFVVIRVEIEKDFLYVKQKIIRIEINIQIRN